MLFLSPVLDCLLDADMEGEFRPGGSLSCDVYLRAGGQIVCKAAFIVHDTRDGSTQTGSGTAPMYLSSVYLTSPHMTRSPGHHQSPHPYLHIGSNPTFCCIACMSPHRKFLATEAQQASSVPSS